MQKNWYIVYTKAKCEKKVANLLTKRKIENFCPLNRKMVTIYRKSRIQHEPLFNSYVFVYVTEEEVSFLKKIDYIVNVVYWKGKPAVISGDEIDAIREFTSNYINIQLQRTKVDYYNSEVVMDEPSYIIDGNLVMVRNRSFKVNLPSMGFTLLADVEMEKDRSLETSFSGKGQLRLQS